MCVVKNRPNSLVNCSVNSSRVSEQFTCQRTVLDRPRAIQGPAIFGVFLGLGLGLGPLSMSFYGPF